MDSGDRERVGIAIGRVGADRSEPQELNGTYSTRFDPAEQSASEAVVAAVAAATGVDPMDLPPIYDSVDPDALCRLIGAPAPGSGRFRGTVTFEYADRLVSVDGSGRVEVDSLDGGTRPTR